MIFTPVSMRQILHVYTSCRIPLFRDDEYSLFINTYNSFTENTIKSSLMASYCYTLKPYCYTLHTPSTQISINGQEFKDKNDQKIVTEHQIIMNIQQINNNI